MEKYKYVIVGNGIAGLRAADTIRLHDKENQILIVSEEPYLSYSRPLISYLIGGETTQDKMYYHDKDWYDKRNIKLMLGQPVVKYMPIENKLALSDGTEIAYEKLLIATGGKTQIPDTPGANLPGVFTFTHLGPTLEIMDMIKKGKVKRAVVVGGGLVGLKACQGLVDAGVDVTCVIASGQIMSQLLDETAASIVKRRLDRKGIRIILNTSVTAITGNGKVEGVVLESGDEHETDIVVLAKGVAPDLKFVKGTEIKCGSGIVVDKHMRTNIPNVWAAGDCTETYEESFGRSTTNLVWPRASEQGQVAGLNMVGIPKEYRGWFWMNSFQFYGLSCISIGDVRPTGGTHEVMISQNIKEGLYRKVVIQNDRIAGALFVGKIATIGTINGLVKKQITIKGHKEEVLEDKLALLIF